MGEIMPRDPSLPYRKNSEPMSKTEKFTAKIKADDIVFAYKLALQSVENDLNALLGKNIATSSISDLAFFENEVFLRAQRIIDHFGFTPEIELSETVEFKPKFSSPPPPPTPTRGEASW